MSGRGVTVINGPIQDSRKGTKERYRQVGSVTGRRKQVSLRKLGRGVTHI